ncbi:MAG: DUF692 domain-containing protein [Sphingobacteriaceae bacterium]|nr:DUF692 domain-containing protein [Sphingobacteriaceae bacterium]
MIGLGYRRDFADEFIEGNNIKPDFVEFAPENWMNIGGYWKKQIDQIAERYPIICHGLSLSIGSPDPLDMNFLKKLKAFLNEYKIEIYSEHLSFAKCDNAHLYDLLPIPFREDAAKHVIQKIKQLQDYLERPFVMENVSYYTPVAAEMSEASFISTIVKESGCQLLLDINNVYVNGFNHKYDPKSFIEKLPLDKVAYIHMAGHEQIEPDLIIDTHGEAIIDPVYDLFEWTIEKIKPVPVLLERDFNIPEMEELNGEMNRLRSITNLKWNKKNELVA